MGKILTKLGLKLKKKSKSKHFFVKKKMLVSPLYLIVFLTNSFCQVYLRALADTREDGLSEKMRMTQIRRFAYNFNLLYA